MPEKTWGGKNKIIRGTDRSQGRKKEASRTKIEINWGKSAQEIRAIQECSIKKYGQAASLHVVREEIQTGWRLA